MQIWSKRVSARVGAKAKEGEWGGGAFARKTFAHPKKTPALQAIRVLNLFARLFSVHVVRSVLLGGKDAIVLVKKDEGTGQKINANNESVAPKKRKSRQDAKENIRLDLLFVVCISMSKVILEVEYSQTSRKRPPKL